MSASPSTQTRRDWKDLLTRHEMLLLYVLIAEWLFFYFAGTTTNRRGVVVGFGTLDRQFDILRHSCEIGLLALAATPKKSAKEGKGEVDVPLKVLGVEVLPGSFLLADEDGLLLLPEPPSGVRSGG